jgi:N utilization substance protein B
VPRIGPEPGAEPMTDEQAGSARRRAREVALQVLFAIDIGADRPRRVESVPLPASTPPFPPPSAAEAFAAVSAHFEMPVAAEAFAQEIVEQVRKHIDILDETISAHARNWRISRMAAVDRNILRLGTWELRFTDTPAPVILNEAVDLARRFSNDPSPAFVNGILDAVARDLRELDT